MTGSVHYQTEGDLAVIALARKPGNVLVTEERAALMAALDAAEADASVRAVLIETALPNFCSGDSLQPGEDGLASPGLAELCLRVERFAKPVIAALKGLALGAGFDLALAAHYRIALGGARMGLPAVTLGLPPAGGAVQRLMRCAPSDAALKILMTGTPVAGYTGADLGLVDRLAEAPLDAAARVYAAELIAAEVRPRPAEAVEGFYAGAAEGLAAVAEARAALEGSRLTGPGRILDCVEAGYLMPYEAALALEADAYAECRASEEAAALMHVARAERQAGAAVRRVTPLDALGVAGGGEAAADLAAIALARGVEVTLYGSDGAGAASVRDLVLDKLGEDARPGEAGTGALHMTTDLEDLRLLPAIAVAVENARRGLTEATVAVGELVSLDRPIITLSAANWLPALVAATGAGEALIALTFGSREASGRLVELIATPDTSEEARRAALGLTRALGRIAVGSDRKPIGPTVSAAARRAAEYMVLHGTPLGRIAAQIAEVGLPPRLLTGLQDPEDPEAVLAGIGDAEIRHRIYGAMANAGANLISEGCAGRPAEIDLCMVHGQGFPRWLGGPMLVADRTDLFRMEQLLLGFAVEGPEIWTPDPLFRDLVKNGRRFDSLN